jgi:lipid-binding SYLF domain-containing protein
MSMTWSKQWCVFLACSAIALGSTQAVASNKSDANQLVVSAISTLENFAADPNMTWYRENVTRAQAVMVVPQLVRAGFIFGASGGSGVILARDTEANTWRGPAFVRTGSVNWGFQAGGSVAEIVMMAMTERGKAALLSTNFQAGLDASVAAGPVGTGAQVATVDILQFARSRGIFGGVSLEGSVISTNETFNRAFWGKSITPVNILVRGRGGENALAKELVKTLTATAGN